MIRAVLLPLLAGCTADLLEIAGRYTDQFGGTHEIDDETWIQGAGVHHVIAFDNDEDWLVAKNDAANDWAADLYSRFEWTRAGERLFFCQVLFDGTDEDAARAAGPADTSDLDGGCDGYEWSELTPR